MKTSLLLYPHQLYTANHLPEVDTVYLVEDPLSFGVSGEHKLLLHKQKLIHMRASMRRYAEEVLWPAGFDVEYIELDVLMQPKDLLLKFKKYDKTLVFDPTNEEIVSGLLEARRELGDQASALEFLPSPNFYLKEHEIRQYFAERHKHPFEEFYQWQRERFNILIEDFKPVGGEWLLTAPVAKDIDLQLPSFAVFGANKWVEDAKKHVSKRFSQHLGSDDCIWPTSHKEAQQWLDDFIEHRIDNYAPYAERFDAESPWLFHSALSVALNSGLLEPMQVVDAALKRHAHKPVPLHSLERFVRQILGYREFTRAISLIGGDEIKTANPLKADKRMTLDWYEGTTGLPVFDDLVKRILARGYAHHSERLLVAGTLMTLCEIDPSDVRQWFTELFVDAKDWSVVPHVYALSQFAGESTLEGGPYICTSKTLIEKSNYERGEWANVWDGLYWRFIEKHRTALSKHPKMRTIISRLDRLDPDQKRIMRYRADDFLSSHTQ